LRRVYLESRQAVAEEDVNGAAPVNEHALKSDSIDATIQDQRETSWLRDGGPLVLPVEGNLHVRPGRKFWVGDQTVCAVHVEAGSLQELSFSLGFNGNFASEDGVDHVGGTNVLVSWVPILVVVFVFVTTTVLLPVLSLRNRLEQPAVCRFFLGHGILPSCDWTWDGVGMVLSMSCCNLTGSLAAHWGA